MWLLIHAGIGNKLYKLKGSNVAHDAYTFRKKREFVFIIIVQSMMSVNRYVLTWRSYSFIGTLHHLIIIIVQAYLKTLNSKSACQI